MIETVDTINGDLRETASLNGDIAESSSLNGNLDSVGNILKEKDVNFYDYDGSLLYSYSADEFLNMYAFPPNPVHKDLVSEGWNWSLENARDYVLDYGKLDLGQVYNVEGNGALLVIKLTDMNFKINENTGYVKLDMYPSGGVSPENAFEVDWGDSSTIDSEYEHYYSAPGEYRIKITPKNNTQLNVEFWTMNHILEEMHIGNLIKESTGGPAYYNLKFFTAPNTSDNTHWGHLTLNRCENFKFFVIPRGVENLIIGFDDFYVGIAGNFVECLKLKVLLPDTIKSLDARTTTVFNNLYIPKTCEDLNLADIKEINNLIIPNNTAGISINNHANSAIDDQNNLYGIHTINNLILPSVITQDSEGYDGYLEIAGEYVNMGDDSNPDYGILTQLYCNNGLIFPTNTIIGENESNAYIIIAGYIGDYVYIPPGITVFDIAFGSFLQLDCKVIDFRNHTQIPEVHDNCFRNYNYAIIVVPDNLYTQWIADEFWSDYASYIVKQSDYDAGNFTPPSS